MYPADWHALTWAGVLIMAIGLVMPATATDAINYIEAAFDEIESAVGNLESASE